MKTAYKYFLVTIVTLLLITITVLIRGQDKSDNQAKYALTLNNEQYLNDERIVGFEVNIADGSFISAPILPIGWNINVNNSASWQCTATGSVEVGAAAMSKDDFEHIFSIIPAPHGDGIPIVDIVITTTRDFDQTTKHNQHKVKLKAL